MGDKLDYRFVVPATTTQDGILKKEDYSKLFSGGSNGQVLTWDSGPTWKDIPESSGNVYIYKSPSFKWDFNGIVTFNHGLGSIPVNAWLGAECIASDVNYNIGEWSFDLLYREGNAIGPINIKVSSSIVSWAMGDFVPYIVNHVADYSADYQNPNVNNWRFYLFAMGV
jgi:hypothetical protein